MWKKVGHFDAAFQTNGTTYFFKGKKYYEFDDQNMRMKVESPKVSAHDWMKCKVRPDEFSLSNSAKSKYDVVNLTLLGFVCSLSKTINVN